MKNPDSIKEKPVEQISALRDRINSLEKAVEAQRQTEDALEKSEKNLSAILANNADGIVIVNTDGIVLYVNPAAEKLFGKSKEDFLGYSFGFPVSADNAADSLVIRRGDTLCEVELRVVGVHWQQRPAFQLSVRDVTGQKQAEASLKESEERYRALFDRSLDLVYIHDFAGNFIDANLSTLQLLGYDREDIPSLNFASLLDTGQLPEAFRTLDELRQTGSQKEFSQLNLKCKDGKYIAVETKESVIYRDNKQYALLGIGRDITARRQAEIDLRESTAQTRKALTATVQAISFMVETRDPYTAGHQHRVADLARNIASEMGLPEEQIDGIRMAGIIHDIGKISIPAEILSMPRKLSDIEFNFIKTHAQAGYEILKDIDFPWPIARMVLEHHERMNGSGYPQGLAGDNLLLESRILSVADVVEAIASHRPYRPSLGIDEALKEIAGNKGVFFDPQVVDACLRLFREKGYKLE